MKSTKEVTRQDELEEHIKNLFKARKAIIKHADGRTGSSAILCPICDIGLLQYSVYPHRRSVGVNAACTNKECVRWVE